MTAFLFSGFGNKRGFPEDIAAALKREITGGGSLVFVASLPSGHEKTDMHADIEAQWFKNAGIEFTGQYVIDDRVNREKALELIGSASCVFLMGGNTLEQIGYIKSNALQKAIKTSGAVITGMSAGAINMAVRSLCLKYKDERPTTVYEGIGVADITIQPHFSINDKDKLEELFVYSEEFPIYAMEDNSAIVVNGNKPEFYGEIYKIRNSRIGRATDRH